MRWSGLRIEGYEESFQLARETDIRKPYNILFILFDTLRADYIEPYGGDAITPEMSRLASDGVTFLNSASQSPLTPISVASFLTGLYPLAHQVKQKTVFPEHLLYLPEILQQNGYQTMAILAGAPINPDLGYGRGFDHAHKFWEEIPGNRLPDSDNSPSTRADYIWSKYIDPMLAEKGDKPFFIYLHELDPHGPYVPLSPYREMYPVPYRGMSDGHVNVRVLKHQAIRSNPFSYRIEMSRQELEHIKALYKGEISYMDALLGELRKRLKRHGLHGNTLIFFTSDHGEEMMEHGLIGHWVTVYQESIHVPMIWTLDGVLAPDRKLSVLAESVDVAPTILDLIGITIPEVMSGKSLLPFLLAAPNEYQNDRPTFAMHTPAYDRFSYDRVQSVRWRDWKMVRRSRKDWDEYQLFNLAEDPLEAFDRWPEKPVIGSVLRQMLHRRVLRDEAIALDEPLKGATIDREMQERLEALGYVQ